MGLIGDIFEGINGSNAAHQAANVQATAATNAAGVIDSTQAGNQNLLGGLYGATEGNYAPYVSTGAASLAQLGAGTQPGGEFNSTPTGAQVLAQDPGYQFRLDQGQLALQRAEAAGGGVGSGGALKSAVQYGQDYASGEYNNAFNRYLQTRQANYSNLANLAGAGLTATGQLGNVSTNYGDTLSKLNLAATEASTGYSTDAARAKASGYVGGANAWNSAIENGNRGMMQALALAAM